MRPAILVILMVLCTLPVEAVPRVVWRWSQKGCEIWGPSFSRDSRQIAFVRQRHWPRGRDAHNAPALVKALEAKRKTNPRIADPEVVVTKIGQRAVLRIGYGWEPHFSPNARSVAFIAQKQPISGKNVDASTLSGNYVALYNRAARQAKAVARPDEGYLSYPAFSANGVKLAYLMGQAIAGAFGGTTGVGLVDLKRNKVFPMFLPQKKDGLFRLFGPPVWSGGQFVVLRVTPLPTQGNALPESVFDLLLLSAKRRVLYTWGKRPASYVPIFGFSPTGRAVIHDGKWLSVDVKSGKARPMPGQDASTRGVISPNVRRIAEVDKSAVFVGDLGRPRQRLPLKLNGEPRGVMWSPDSKYLALVINRGTVRGDELVIVKL
ncbi:MAG: hypothetical protein FJX76_20080 [Armatimonadetes bacterium]|nr:hypothetical protein [Armatimonadota bacterium]